MSIIKCLTAIVSAVDGYGGVGVIENVSDERFNMAVRQAVKHVSTIASTRDKMFLQQNAQTLGGRGHFRTGQFSNLRDLMLSGEKQLENAQASRITRCPKHSGCAIDDRIGYSPFESRCRQ